MKGAEIHRTENLMRTNKVKIEINELWAKPIKNKLRHKLVVSGLKLCYHHRSFTCVKYNRILCITSQIEISISLHNHGYFLVFQACINLHFQSRFLNFSTIYWFHFLNAGFSWSHHLKCYFLGFFILLVSHSILAYRYLIERISYFILLRRKGPLNIFKFFSLWCKSILVLFTCW